MITLKIPRVVLFEVKYGHALIRELNPNVQIILTTHSPAMIMDGWVDAVTEVSDITV